jgi:hypothetical protein
VIGFVPVIVVVGVAVASVGCAARTVVPTHNVSNNQPRTSDMALTITKYYYVPVSEVVVVPSPEETESGLLCRQITIFRDVVPWVGEDRARMFRFRLVEEEYRTRENATHRLERMYDHYRKEGARRLGMDAPTGFQVGPCVYILEPMSGVFSPHKLQATLVATTPGAIELR